MYKNINQLGILLIIIGILLLCLQLASAENGIDGSNNTNLTQIPQQYSQSPFIIIDSIVNHSVDDVFFINGTTNLPVSENLTLGLGYGKYWDRPHMHYDPAPLNSSAIIPDIKISPALSRTNRWSVNVTDIVREYGAGEYSFYISSIVDYRCNTPGCSVPKAINVSYFTILQTNNDSTQIVFQNQAQTSFPIQSVTGKPSPSPTTQVIPLDLTLSIASLGLMLIFRFIYSEKHD
jgi:hypothetical protein